MIQLKESQVKALEDKIYNKLMENPEMGLGEMGECRDEAERIVQDWLQEQQIKIEDEEANKESGFSFYDRWEHGDPAFQNQGGFTTKLFHAFQHASADNRQLLTEAFPHWFKKGGKHD